MATKAYPFSDLLRGPNNVFPALDDGNVLLERRNAMNVVLIREDRFEAATAGMDVAVRVLRSLTQTEPENVAAVFVEQQSWLQWLPEDERAECVAEMMRDLSAGAETGSFTPFVNTMRAWQSTAEVWADPNLAKRLMMDVDGDGPELDRPSQP